MSAGHETSQLDLRRNDLGRFSQVHDHTAKVEPLPSTDFPIGWESSSEFMGDDSLRTLALSVTPSRPSWIPRPAWWVRSMWFAMVLILAAFTMLAGLLAHLIQDLSLGLQAQQQTEPLTPLAEPLPPPSVLLAENEFAAAMITHPSRRHDLQLARAAALWDDGQMVAALGLLRQLSTPYRRAQLQPRQILRLADLHTQTGHQQQARQLLSNAPLATWPAAERQQAVALLGRIVAAADE